MMQIFIRIFICLFIGSIALYLYIDRLNELTELRLSIPLIAKEVQEIKEKNLELQYAIECFESPLHLMELARKPEFGHLRYPSLNEVVILKAPKHRETYPNEALENDHLE